MGLHFVTAKRAIFDPVDHGGASEDHHVDGIALLTLHLVLVVEWYKPGPPSRLHPSAASRVRMSPRVRMCGNAHSPHSILIRTLPSWEQMSTGLRSSHGSHSTSSPYSSSIHSRVIASPSSLTGGVGGCLRLKTSAAKHHVMTSYTACNARGIYKDRCAWRAAIEARITPLDIARAHPYRSSLAGSGGAGSSAKQ